MKTDSDGSNNALINIITNI